MPAPFRYQDMVQSPEFKALPLEVKRQKVERYLAKFERDGTDREAPPTPPIDVSNVQIPIKGASTLLNTAGKIINKSLIGKAIHNVTGADPVKTSVGTGLQEMVTGLGAGLADQAPIMVATGGLVNPLTQAAAKVLPAAARSIPQLAPAAGLLGSRLAAETAGLAGQQVLSGAAYRGLSDLAQQRIDDPTRTTDPLQSLQAAGNPANVAADVVTGGLNRLLPNATQVNRQNPNNLMPFLGRNVMQTVAQTGADVANTGRLPTPQEFGTNLATGLAFDAATGIKSVETNAKNRRQFSDADAGFELRGPDVVTPDAPMVRPDAEPEPVLTGDRQRQRGAIGIRPDEPQPGAAAGGTPKDPTTGKPPVMGPIRVDAQTYANVSRDWVDVGPDPKAPNKRIIEAATPDGPIQASVTADKAHIYTTKWEVARQTADGARWIKPVAQKPTAKGIETGAKILAEPVRADLPKYAGDINTNLQRITAPSDIKTLIDTVAVSHAGEIQTQRRGVISHEETQALADALGMTPQDVLDRKIGQAWNPEQITAARQILVSSADNVTRLAKEIHNGNDSTEFLAEFQRAVDLHSAIQAQVSGATAEAGRALNSFKIPATSNAGRMKQLQKMLDQRGGRTAVEDLARLLANADNTEAAKLIRLSQKTGFIEAITAIRKAGMLTGVKTHLRNIGGNVVFQGLEEASRLPASIIDIAISSVTKQRTVGGLDAVAIGKASYEAATKGMKAAKSIMKTGASPEALDKFDLPRELNTGWLKVGQTSVVDAYVNGVFRLLGAEDQVFKAYAGRRSIEEQAKLLARNEARSGAIPRTDIKARQKSLSENPTEAMLMQAVADAEFATFQNDNLLADAVTGGKRMVMVKGAQAGPIGEAAARTLVAGFDLVVPFVKTPTNILARVLEYSPVGFAGGAARVVALKAMRQQFGAAEQRAFSQTFGRATVGTAIIALGYWLASRGEATGIYDKEHRGQQAVDEAAGRAPMSVKLGDTWYQVGGVAPAGNLLAIGATLYREGMRDLKDPAQRLANIAEVGTRTLNEMPLLQGINTLDEALDNPSAAGGKLASNVAGSFIPTLASDVSGLADQSKRRSEGVAEGLQARTPARTGLPERLDVFGEPLPQNPTDAIDPTQARPDKASKDPVLRELVDLGIGIQKPKQTIEVDGKVIRLTPEQHNELIKATGQAAKKILDRLVPRLQSVDRDRKRQIIEDAIQKARSGATRQFKTTIRRP